MCPTHLICIPLSPEHVLDYILAEKINKNLWTHHEARRLIIHVPSVSISNTCLTWIQRSIRCVVFLPYPYPNILKITMFYVCVYAS